jgi:hypothetical protein
MECEDSMSAVQRLSDLLMEGQIKLSKEEQLILDAELFARICEELKEIIKSKNKDYYRLLKINKEKEQSMIDESFIRCIIHDILSTEEYTLPGIAYYTDTPEEIILDVASGCNKSPALLFSQKIINLHRSVRPELYIGILNKIRVTDGLH